MLSTAMPTAVTCLLMLFSVLAVLAHRPWPLIFLHPIIVACAPLQMLLCSLTIIIVPILSLVALVRPIPRLLPLLFPLTFAVLLLATLLPLMVLAVLAPCCGPHCCKVWI
jgi:hypothetical protein